ncbi:hypothetical protein V1508DRAFT_350485 [Lipomyces doorenjongii]|uniref:uncharacterized protein n=1 Tax=Lipomyces doorenjongii TaxID=383834 RepID=UPI0034CEFA2F
MSDDEDAGGAEFAVETFRPGSAAINGIAVSDGWKCLRCELAGTHKCTQSSEALRSHFKRVHANDGDKADSSPVRVQALYGRSSAQHQLRYVEVSNNWEPQATPEVGEYDRFGIPADVHYVQSSHSGAPDKRDANLFGQHFLGYKLLERLSLEELAHYLHNPQGEAFKLLKWITRQILDDSRAHTTAGFQMMLAKLMSDNDRRDFFHEVQEVQTVEKYSGIWCKVLWVAALAVSEPCTLTRNLTLTADQVKSAEQLVGALNDAVSCGELQGEDAALQKALDLSTHILRHRYAVTNRVDDTGSSTASSYLVPRAINLLSLRLNGAFVSYQQITHITAAIRYVLRSIMLYNVMAKDGQEEDEMAVDREIWQYLSRDQSSAFAYCVQVHAACSSYGSQGQLPTITWATGDFTALRLTSGVLLSLDALKLFLSELYDSAEALLPEVCLDVHVPIYYARNLRDNYSNTEPGYSFLSDKSNKLSPDYLWMAMHRDRALRGKYVVNDRIIVGAAQAYLKSATALLETLFLLMHLTYGSPARMTEIDSWKHVNSLHGVRNVYCHPRGLVFLGLYNKTTSMTGMKRLIVHLVPARLEKLFLAYLIFVRPLER